MKAAYFQCIGGASGDMILAALLDAGLALEELKTQLARIPAKGYEIRALSESRGGVSGTRVVVDLEAQAQRRNSFEELMDYVYKSSLSKAQKEKGIAVLSSLREGEERAHPGALASEPLKELGDLDTLVDVMGAVVGLEILGVQELYSSPIPSGYGVISTQHGSLPAPGPATLAILARKGATVRAVNDAAAGEMVTPTGAAILSTLATFSAPTLTLERAGYGLGTREVSSVPNVLSVWIGEKVASGSEEDLVLLETNMDDQNPQMLGYAQELLMERGARDVWFTAIQMKKNRPGIMLCVLAPASREKVLVETILQETSTLGIRRRLVQRHEAYRGEVVIESSLGRLPVKVKRLEGRIVSISPEYEACRPVAKEMGLPLQEVYRRLTKEAYEKLQG